MSGKRLYGRSFYNASRAFLVKHPVCSVQGCGRRATRLDHVVPHKGNLALFWNTSNWQGLCESCHNAKTATKDSKFAPDGNVKGCDPSGVPLDSKNPWRKRLASKLGD